MHHIRIGSNAQKAYILKALVDFQIRYNCCASIKKLHSLSFTSANEIISLVDIRHAYEETEKDKLAKFSKRANDDPTDINPRATKKKKDASDEVCTKVEEELCIVLFRQQNCAPNN